MRRLAGLLAILCFTISAPVKAQALLSVSPLALRLRIALPRSADSLWSWYRPTTPDHRMEFGWMFVVPGNPEYSVGWMLFKRSGTRPMSGSLSDLLRAGQSSAFGGGQRAQLLRRIRPRVSADADTLMIELRDSTAIAEIFRTKPDSVILTIILPDNPASLRKIRVHYEPMPNQEL
jgi:hypothetical protein